MGIIQSRIADWKLVQLDAPEDIKERCELRIKELALLKEMIVEEGLEHHANKARCQ